MVLFCVRLGLDQIVIRNRDHAGRRGIDEPAPRRDPDRPTPARNTRAGRHPRPRRASGRRSEHLHAAPRRLSRHRPRRRGLVDVQLDDRRIEQKAAGDKPAALDAAGERVPDAERSRAHGGSRGRLGGAYLAILGAGTFEPFMTNGAGFIAIVIQPAPGRAFWWSSAARDRDVVSSTALQVHGSTSHRRRQHASVPGRHRRAPHLRP